MAGATAATVFTANAAATARSSDSTQEMSSPPDSSGNNPASRIPRVTLPGVKRGEMLYRELGTTGVQVSVIGLGGSHLGQADVEEDAAIQLIHEAIERGINFLDNAWDYNEGRSEERVGKALAQGGYREKAFVMTKIDGRTRETAANQINDSLKRLKVDRIDLLQHHEIIRFDDPDRIFNEGGAMEAVLEAKAAGKVRFIGFTGHKDPHVHLYMLEVAKHHGFHFDSVQMPINILDAHFRSFAQLVAPEALRQNIAILGMKCFGSGVFLKSDLLKNRVVTPIECLHYSLSLPISVQITGINSRELLDQAFSAVQSFQPLDNTALAALLAKSQEAADRGKYELFKTTAHFDTTARHPDWLGSDSKPVQQLAPQLPG